MQQQYEARKEELREKLRIRKHVELESQIKEAETTVAILREQSKQIEADVEDLRERAEDIGESSVDLEMMRADYEQMNVLYQSLQAERQKLNVELNSGPRIHLVQRSEVPKFRDDPSIRFAVVGFLAILGFSLPICGVALWDIQTQRINSSSEVAKRLGLTVFGSVPMIPDRAIRKLASPSKERRHWHGRLTESVDGISARLLRKASVDGRRVVLVSSAVSGEGKTTLATQLAMSLARSGRKTVLVDFDLRRPVIERIFGLDLEPGISNVLREESTMQDAAQETQITNLHVVPAGRLDQDALVALSKGGDKRIFESPPRGVRFHRRRRQSRPPGRGYPIPQPERGYGHPLDSPGRQPGPQSGCRVRNARILRQPGRRRRRRRSQRRPVQLRSLLPTPHVGLVTVQRRPPRPFFHLGGRFAGPLPGCPAEGGSHDPPRDAHP